MPTLTDARFDALRILVPLSPPTTNDMLFDWLATEGGTGLTLDDRWNTMLLGKVAIGGVQGHRSDMWKAVLVANGFTQPHIQDAELAFWVAGGALIA